MLDALAEIAGLERPHKRDAVVPHAHELHPEALAQPRAVVALLCDLGLVPPAGLLFACKDFADAPGEAALLRLDEMTDDLVGAPLLWIEVPARVVAESDELGIDEGARRFEILGDLIGCELGRRAHETSCGALRMGIFTLSTTVPSARASWVESPWRSSRRSLRRMPDWSSPSGGSSLPSLCRSTSSVSSFHWRPRPISLACSLSIRSTSESWIRRKIATSSSDGSRRSRPVLEKSMRTPCLSMSVWTYRRSVGTRPRSSRIIGRSSKMNPRSSCSVLLTICRSEASSPRDFWASTSKRRSLISDWRTTFAIACAGPSWTCRAMRLRSSSCVSTTACSKRL